MDRHTQDADTHATGINPAKRRPTRAHSPALIDLGLLDELRGHTAEATEFARRSVYGPLPATPCDPADMYDWISGQVPGDRQDEWDAIAWRHKTERSLRDDNQKPVRQQSCPACGCWGLVWDRYTNLVVCMNLRCTTDTGAPVSWSLQQIAAHAVTATRRRQAGAS